MFYRFFFSTFLLSLFMTGSLRAQSESALDLGIRIGEATHKLSLIQQTAEVSAEERVRVEVGTLKAELDGIITQARKAAASGADLKPSFEALTRLDGRLAPAKFAASPFGALKGLPFFPGANGAENQPQVGIMVSSEDYYAMQVFGPMYAAIAANPAAAEKIISDIKAKYPQGLGAEIMAGQMEAARKAKKLAEERMKEREKNSK